MFHSSHRPLVRFSRQTAISVENHKKKISHPLYFAPPLKGAKIQWWEIQSTIQKGWLQNTKYIIPLSLELGTGAGCQKSRMTGLPGRQRSLTIFSRLDTIAYTNVTDGRTDRQSDRQTDRHRATAKTAHRHIVAQ